MHIVSLDCLPAICPPAAHHPHSQTPPPPPSRRLASHTGSLPSISIVCLTARPVERARKRTKRGCHPSIPPIVPVNGVATSCSAQQFIGQEEEKCQLFNATLTTYPSLSCPRSQPRSPTLLSKLVGCRALPHHCPSRQCVSLNPRLRGHASSS